MPVRRRGSYDDQSRGQIRRFVIIRQMLGHCICLPILTYSGQGTNKRGVNPDAHAAIYSGEEPFLQIGEIEKGLRRAPIRVEPISPRHKPLPMSRLNYEKLYTVEYNLKVWFIGSIHRQSRDQLIADFDSVHPPMSASIVPISNTSSLPTSNYLGSTSSSSHELGDQSEVIYSTSQTVATRKAGFKSVNESPNGFASSISNGSETDMPVYPTSISGSDIISEATDDVEVMGRRQLWSCG